MSINFSKNRFRYAKILVILTIVFVIKIETFAQQNKFSIDYNIEYEIDGSGESVVTQKAIITNLKNDAIPTNYTFSARQLKIYDVTSQTNERAAKARIDEKEDETLISVTIENYAIGEGRQNTVSIEYKTQSIASKSGEIWNIYIPKIQIPETTTLYNVKLSIPASFGPKIYLSPAPVIEREEDGNYVYYFTKETFITTGITAAFGKHQPVNFKLRYQIKNHSILPSLKEVALPLDIQDVQNVSYESINPKPFRVRTDPDGNFIAIYILRPLKELEIEVMGTARLYGKQINPNFGRDFSEIPSDLINKYTKPDKYWEVDSPYIKKLVEELKDEDINVTKNAQKIYNFITQNLTYDFEALENGLVERKGAEAALVQKGSWTCMEFADLFITTARAMGIPAREINGYAFTFDSKDKPISINLNSGDFLHSWAEFYDPFYGWVQVDPTWGTTSGIDYFSKLDTNHFAFVVKGQSSEHPFPAGTYRFSDTEKLVEVALSQTTSDDDFKPVLKAQKVFNFNLFEIIRNHKRIRVENVGKVFAYNVEGKSIPIGKHIFVYVKKDIDKISIEDLNRNKYPLEIQ